MTKLIHSAICALMVFSSQAQFKDQLSFQAAYSGGMFLHPVLTLGADLAFGERVKQKPRERTIRHDYLVGADVGGYYHKRYHTGVWGQGRIGWRRTKLHRIGHYRTVSLGVGYLGTFIANSYAVDDEDNVRYRSAVGYGHFLLAPSVEWGADLQKPFLGADAWFICPKVQLQFNYFQGPNKYFLFETGLRF
ncbi:MAG TPA: hypothetical protein PKN30_14550 [Flavobacteriales bacterium]|nr:hypothetical protein [Flavobacteriales bacterium]